MTKRLAIVAIGLCLAKGLEASSGTEGAAFLNIPVGSGPTAMGAAYGALAHNVYGTIYNPAGLGFLASPELAGQHHSYLEGTHYEHLAYAHPIGERQGLGISLQYFGSGDITETDRSGNTIGDYSSSYGAYALTYGRQLSSQLSLGANAKWIHATISNYHANALAADLGAMWKPRSRWTGSAVLTNIGRGLQFIDQRDSLPLAFKVGGAYTADRWLASSEVVYRKSGLASIHFGGEWRPIQMIALRAGYRTDTLKGLSPLAGVSTGFGVEWMGHELAYAFLPFGDLGSTHSISLLLRFGKEKDRKRNLIQYQQIKTHRSVKGKQRNEQDAEGMQLMELINNDQPHQAKKESGR